MRPALMWPLDDSIGAADTSPPSIADQPITVRECAAALEQQKSAAALGGVMLGGLLGLAVGGLAGFLLARWTR